jgi:hypothetical protein
MPGPRLYLNSPIANGPILSYIRKRGLAIWAIAAAIGLLPTLFSLSPKLQAAGLGLWLPGGGFLLSGHPLIFVSFLFIFAISLVLWLLVGGFIFPILAWLTPALLAPLTVDMQAQHWATFAIPTIAFCFIGLYQLNARRKLGPKRERAEKLQTYLNDIPLTTPSNQVAIGDPLNEKELGSLRYILELALQPIEEFSGFVKIDQFREAAWRYQLVAINYALAALQTCRMPAFSGYMHEAQRRAIVKMQDRRVWHYWRVENALGNFRFDADPIKKDNIMYSGWWALALGSYERASGDLQFSKQDALTLEENPQHHFRYDFPRIVDVVSKQFDNSKLSLFPCEPNWVFAICNLFGMTGALVFDKVHGTRHALDRLEKFNHIIETEFTMAEGRTATIMSSRSGIILAGGGPFAYLGNIWLLNMTSPRIAQAYWALAKYMLTEEFGDDMNNWTPSGPGMLDAGNYTKNGVFFWITIMQSAKEMGDLDIYEFARQRYENMGTEWQDGALHHKGSVMAQCFSHIARFGTPNFWHCLAHGEVPPAINCGPRLESVPYPAVLVAAADNDGETLSCTLCTDNETAKHELCFSRLAPNRKYNLLAEDGGVIGAVSSDQYGCGTILTTLAKRNTLRLVIEP